VNQLICRAITFTLLAAFLAACHKKSDSALSGKEKIGYERRDKIWNEYDADLSTNGLDKFENSAWGLVKDYPNEVIGYELVMNVIEDREFFGDRDKARATAQELIQGTAPDQFKVWAKGFIYRLDTLGKPVAMQFTAVDGRKVDLAKMTGKVVLVDFWATRCGPCVAELPRVKAMFDKYQQQGFEVIGISCDTDKARLQRYVKEKGINWPQYFHGKQQSENRFTQAFGINGIPHMFLVDRKGCLRLDNVRARDKDNLEEKIVKLLAE
jgi:thiol-disulfide isomerase/thioredoxin